MNPIHEIIHRYSAPTILNEAPTGTLCKVAINEIEYEIYVQVGKDETKWYYIGAYVL
jgi:hypothetical protein